MIGKLTGIIDTVGEEHIILNVNDVGYLVFCSLKTIDRIREKKEKISLLIETIVKEDSISFFGFHDELEKETFNTLCKVSGVGNKMSIKILSSLTAEEVILAIANKNKEEFTGISGIGDKIAVRIITELAKCSLVKNIDNIKFIASGSKIASEEINNKTLLNDTIRALESLGYQKNYVYGIVSAIIKEKPHLTLESIITESLKVINNM